MEYKIGEHSTCLKVLIQHDMSGNAVEVGPVCGRFTTEILLVKTLRDREFGIHEVFWNGMLGQKAMR